MNADNLEHGLISRYVLNAKLGSYPPWQGYSVTDSLSGKSFLLFYLEPHLDLPLSLGDLKMRDIVFSSASENLQGTVTLQKNDSGITFLLPFTELAPLEKALTSIDGDLALRLVKSIVETVLTCHKSNLFFYNLTPESIAISGESAMILPTAYLLHREILSGMTNPDTGKTVVADDRVEDLRSLGTALSMFTPYLNPQPAHDIERLAKRLCSLEPGTGNEGLNNLFERMNEQFGLEPHIKPVISEPGYIPPAASVRVFKQAAIKARDKRKQLVLIKGKSGEGRTMFLEHICGRLKGEWGFKSGEILSDQRTFQFGEGDTLSRKSDFLALDAHNQEPLLACYILDRIFQDFEHCRLVILAVDDPPPRFLIDYLVEEAARREISIREISLPVVGKAVKKKILSKLLEKESDGITIVEEMDAGQPLALTALAMRLYYHTGLLPKFWEKSNSILDPLTAEERSVLGFLALFNFEVPLIVLKDAYQTEESSIYTTLQRLVTLGFVTSRIERSVLSNGEFCSLYSLKSKHISDIIVDNIPDKRRKQIHKNILMMLKEIKNSPSPYLFFHQAHCGDKAEAALLGYELFHQILGEKRFCTISCFNESYLNARLDKHLPPEMRFKLLLELGNFFSLTGNLVEAEKLYRSCRIETKRSEHWKKFRSLSVEAVRKECEILEKKGEFIKAEKVLKKALDSHGEHIPSNERAKLYNDLAWLRYRLGQFDKSWEDCLLVLKLLDKKQHPIETAQAYNLLGTINWNRSKYENAIFCHNKCLALREECLDEIGIGASYNNLGLVYRSMGRIKESLECFMKSMEIKRKHNNLPGIAAAHLNIATAYIDMENFKEAEENCQIAYSLSEDIGNQQLLAESSGIMGEIHHIIGDFKKARDYYFRNLHICHITKSQREKAVALRRLSELSFAEGKITEANGLLSQAKNLNRRIGSRLEKALLTLLEGRISLARGNREEGLRKLEGASLELSLLGRKNTAAVVAAEIGELFLTERNEPVAREYLMRATSLASESEAGPKRVQQLQENLNSGSALSIGRIRSDSDRLKVLCRITSIIRTTSDPYAFNKAIIETAREITGMTRGALILQNKSDDSFQILSASEEFGPGGVLNNKNIIAILNIAKQLGYPLDTSRTNIPAGKVSDSFIKAYPSIICIPLWIRDGVTGFMYLDSPRGDTIASSENHSFLVSFGQQVSLGLEKILIGQEERRAERPKPSIKPAIAKSKEHPSFDDIIGNSPAIRHIFELIDSIKDMDTTVLLTGQSGVGKDLIAKTIHYASQRRDKPFHSLNCPAIPSELLESQLFGHEKGAFTGAHRQMIGHFETTRGGTIYLNEIGDMPLGLQPKILRVLEEQKFYRVGDTKETTTDVRIIAATNKDLLELVKQGRFRVDLYYRLNIFPITIPPLKERKEDIEPLCNHFLTTLCNLYNIPPKKLSHESLMHMINYEWPGNVRELENTINRLIIISKKDTILPEDLPDDILRFQSDMHAESLTTLEEDIEALLEKMEFSAGDPVLPRIQGALARKMVDRIGDKTKAAALLGISKPTLYSRLKDYEKNG